MDSVRKSAYEAGQAARKADRLDNDNPYEPSGHERDTTYQDELNYIWDRGYHNPEEPYDPDIHE